jgi:hypothetical protein
VLVLTGIYAVLVIITAVMAGPWSDRVGKRKPFVIGSSAIIALAGLIMAFFPVWPGALAGAAVLGVGFGAYLAVDYALLTQVLPQAPTGARTWGSSMWPTRCRRCSRPAARLPCVTYLGRLRVTLFIRCRRHRPAGGRVRGEDQGRPLTCRGCRKYGRLTNCPE